MISTCKSINSLLIKYEYYYENRNSAGILRTITVITIDEENLSSKFSFKFEQLI